MKALILIPVVVGAVSAGAAVSRDFSVYQRDIIDRHPFGKPAPKPVVTTQAPVKPPDPPPAILNDLKLVSIVNDPRTGIRAGVVNARKKKVYYLSPGQTDGDLTLVSADLDAQKVTVKYGTHEKELVLGGAAGKSSHSAPPMTAGAKAPPTVKKTSKPPTKILSYRDRLKERTRLLEERRKKAEATEKLSKEELKKHLKNKPIKLLY